MAFSFPNRKNLPKYLELLEEAKKKTTEKLGQGLETVLLFAGK